MLSCELHVHVYFWTQVGFILGMCRLSFYLSGLLSYVYMLAFSSTVLRSSLEVKKKFNEKNLNCFFNKKRPTIF